MRPEVENALYLLGCARQELIGNANPAVGVLRFFREVRTEVMAVFNSAATRRQQRLIRAGLEDIQALLRVRLFPMDRN